MCKLENIFLSAEIFNKRIDNAIRICLKLHNEEKSIPDGDFEAIKLRYLKWMPYVLENFKEEIKENTEADLIVDGLISRITKRHSKKDFKKYMKNYGIPEKETYSEELKKMASDQIMASFILDDLSYYCSALKLDVGVFQKKYRPKLTERLQQYYSSRT